VENVEDKIRISVIISAYAASLYIEECIESVASQSYFEEYNDYEILIGIDGCEETLNKILEIKHKFKNLKIAWFPKNIGPYLVFNTLIQISNFQVISIFGADDIMKSHFISENVRILKNRSCVFARGQNFIDPNKEKIVREYNPDGVILFHKKDFLEINGFDNWRCGADSDLKTRFMLNKIKMIESEAPTFLRRLHQKSLTSIENKYGFGSKYRMKIQSIVRSRKEAKIVTYKTSTKYKLIKNDKA
jgi:glycosyltransferase involved in cell wall biosynthesis